jgi:hypothetical protein
LGWSGRIVRLLCAADAQHLEFSGLRHRIFVLLSQVSAVNERIDARWERVRNIGVLETVQRDSSRVLFTSKHQLRFLLTASFLSPDRHRDRHQNRHDRQRHQQGCHRVATLIALTM